MLSPDPAFSETGSITGIKYGDHFKQYKKLIVKILRTPQMQVLFTWLNEEFFLVDYPEPQPSTPPTRGASEDEDNFTCAFNDEGIQGMLASISVCMVFNDPLRWKHNRVGHYTSPHSFPSTNHLCQTNPCSSSSTCPCQTSSLPLQLQPHNTCATH
jgi:hypothetical protein